MNRHALAILCLLGTTGSPHANSADIAPASSQEHLDPVTTPSAAPMVTASKVDARRNYRGYDTMHIRAADRSSLEEATAHQLADHRSGTSSPSGNSSALSASPNRGVERNAAIRGRSSTSGMHFERSGPNGGAFVRRS
jgi:hypothetical protein